ncbi:hypothetical protein PYW07_003980 [Mythimna separata]|uniref:Uncharacterized protein n=1 Tax=Mythimna separata TaxID=271217 RepID=A0AAD7YQL9_MYTSE|nr:hypothetical protein PYW07_003980 [Mythimna separata]
MEINIKNAFKEAVKLSCGPCVKKYHVLTEMNQKLCLQIISFFLKRPFLTTALVSVLIILLIIILSAAFIILVGVLMIVILILLFEGFIFIVLVIVISMIIATVTLFVMIIAGVQYKVSIIHNLD